MFIIAGLGNPTLQYEGTRHNVGFDVIDMLADRYNISVDGRKGRALIGKGMIGGQKVLLVKPQTYMNLSGESVRSLLDYYKVDEEQELLVIYDDISLVPGGIRIRKKGSAGGHNGIKNIIAHLGTQEFRACGSVWREAGAHGSGRLCAGTFSERGSRDDDDAFKDGAAAVVDMMTEGVEAAMNHFNGAARGRRRS